MPASLSPKGNNEEGPLPPFNAFENVTAYPSPLVVARGGNKQVTGQLFEAKVMLTFVLPLMLKLAWVCAAIPQTRSALLKRFCPQLSVCSSEKVVKGGFIDKDHSQSIAEM